MRRTLRSGLLLSLVLAGCGGGGGGDDGGGGNPPPPPPVSPPSNLSYVSPQSVALNASVSLSPTVTGTVTSYSITPGLPAGITLNTTTGVISGSSATPVTETAYTITASNSGGSTTFTLRLQVFLPAPSAFSYASPQILRVGDAVNLVPSVAGTVDQYSALALPAGLSLNGATGVISGTPTTAEADHVYTIVATNASGSASFELTIRVRNAAPTSLAYPDAQQLNVGAAVNLAPTVTGVVDSFEISPALPAGLSLNAATGVISGTPDSVSSLQNFTVTASNDGGSTQYSLPMIVRMAPPSALSYTSPVTIDVGAFVAAISPTVTGSVSSYTISSDLPSGLSFNTTTGVISGTPWVSYGPTNIQVTAHNPGGVATFTLNLQVRSTLAAPVAVTYTPFVISDPVYNNQPITLYAWEGRNVAVLTRDTNRNAGAMQLWIEALDRGWDFYLEATGRSPPMPVYKHHGKVTIAEVPKSCGARCAQVGLSGIEAETTYFNQDFLGAIRGIYGGYLFFEMGYNFLFYDEKVGYKHPSYNTVFNGYAVLMQWWAMDAANVEVDADACFASAAQARAHFEGMVDRYIADTTLNWSNTLALGRGVGAGCSSDGPVLFTSIFMRMLRDYGTGGGFALRLWKEVAERPDANTDQDAVDNMVIATSRTAGSNLARIFEEELRWPVSAAAKAELEAALGTAIAPGPDYPRLQFTASPNVGGAGLMSTLRWTASNVASCDASGAWSGSRGNTGEDVVGPLSVDSSFTLTCTSGNGQVRRTVDVDIVAPPTVTFSARPATVGPGGIPVLGWRATNATSCTAASGWATVLPTVGEMAVGPVNQDTSFSIRCDGLGGSVTRNVTVAVDPQILPVVEGPVRIARAEFVELEGRAEHEGLTAISLEPVLDGTAPLFRMVLFGPVGTAPEFRFVSDAGADLGSAPLTKRVESAADDFDYLGSLDIPAQPFRIRVSGMDSNGSGYLLETRLFTPQNFGGRFPARALGLRAGVAATFTLTVTNYGETSNFWVSFQTGTRIFAIPILGLYIPEGESRDLQVPVRLLANVGDYLSGTVTAVITRVGSATPEENRTTLRLIALPASELQ